MERHHSGSSAPTEAGTAAPVVDHSNAPHSRDFPLNDLNGHDDTGKLHTPFSQGTSASLDAKPEGSVNESTQDINITDTVKIDSSASKAELEPSNISLDKKSKIPEEGQARYARPADRVEEPAHILPGSYTDGAKDIVKDGKYEDPAMDLTSNKPLGSVKENIKPLARGIDTVEAAVHDSTGLDSDQASTAGVKSEGIPPKYTENVASLEAPLNIFKDETNVTVTSSINGGKIAGDESQGLDADHMKQNSSLSKEPGLHRQGPSQGDRSWTCRRCGWVYPNAHPSAKHRRKHKKQCGKVKGFELHAEPHKGGSSDEVSSDEDVHFKKEHVPHPPLQPLQPQEQANVTVARESLPSNVDQSANLVEGEGITECASNSQQCIESSAQVDVPDRELGETQNVKETLTPHTVPSVVPEPLQNIPFLDQQNLPAGNDKKDVSDEPDISSAKKSPRHLNMKEDNPLNQVPSSPTSVDTLASESHGELGIGAIVEHGKITKFAEEPVGLLAEHAPNVASLPSVSDLNSSDAPPVHFEDNNGSGIGVDKPAVLSALDPRDAGLSNETSHASAGQDLNEGVILNQEKEKPGLTELDEYTMANDSLKKDLGATATGGSTGQNTFSDLSSHSLPADEVPIENKSVTQNLVLLTALSAGNGTGLANNKIEEGRLLNVQPDTNPAQLAPENELLAQIVGGVNDDTVLSIKDKTDETTPVANTEHPTVSETALSSIDKTNKTFPITEGVLDNQMASKEDAPKEVNIPAVTSGEAVSIQRSLDKFPLKDNPPVAEGSGQGETEGYLEYTKAAKESGVVGTAKGSEIGGIAKGISPAAEVFVPKKTEASHAPEGMVKPETTEEIPLKTGGVGLLSEMAKPKAEDETPSETDGIVSSELSYHDTYSFSRSESLVTAPSGFSLVSAPSDVEVLSHKFSESIEIFEDAPDSLDTCSVGGSVDENESWDEPRQASGRLREEPEKLRAVSSEERVPSQSVTAIMEPKGFEAAASGERIQSENAMVEQAMPATEGSRLGEESSKERVSIQPGTSFGGKNKVEDLKAPSPEAWQEPGPLKVKSEGVTSGSKSDEGLSTALRNLMAKEEKDKVEPDVETSTPAANAKSSNRKEGSAASTKGRKPKIRSFWKYCVCSSAVN